jgi:hypothetical protein
MMIRTRMPPKTTRMRVLKDNEIERPRERPQGNTCG